MLAEKKVGGERGRNNRMSPVIKAPASLIMAYISRAVDVKGLRDDVAGSGAAPLSV